MNADYERLGEPSVTLDDIRHFRQLDSKAPGHPEYHWVSGVETTTGPLGQGVATSVGMAIAEKWLADSLQPARLRDLRLQHLRRLRRRLPDGRRRVRGRVARRPPRPRQPLLDLRQQPHHDRREHRPHLHRGRRGPVPRLWLERPARRRRQRHRPHRACPRGLPARPRAGRRSSSSTATSATARPTSRTPPPPTASRSATRRSGSRKRVYGWPEDAKFLVPDGVYEHFAAGIGSARRARRGATWTELFAAYRTQYPELADGDRSDAAARTAGRLGPQSPGLPGRPEGHRGARGLGQGAERARAEHPVVPRRLGRPRPVEQDDADVRGRRRFPGRQPGRQEPALRHPRARDGRRS